MTLNLSNSTVGSCQLEVFGKVATLYVSGLKNLVSQTYTQFVTIPEGYRPRSRALIGTYSMGDSSYKVILDVQPTGAVRYYSYATGTVASPNVYFGLTWIIV